MKIAVELVEVMVNNFSFGEQFLLLAKVVPALPGWSPFQVWVQIRDCESISGFIVTLL